MMYDELKILADGLERAGHPDADTCRKAIARIAELEAALAPFAAIDGVAQSILKLPPKQDRLWSYYERRHGRQHEITRAHIIEAARVLGRQS